MYKEYVKKFYYNSLEPQIFETTFSSSNAINLVEFKVVAQHSIARIFKFGYSRFKDIKGAIEIGGSMIIGADYKNYLSIEPFDVTLHAYIPINRTPYCAKVLGIHICKVRQGSSSCLRNLEFAAANIINWERLI